MTYCATISEYGRLTHKSFKVDSSDEAIEYATSKWDTISVYHWVKDNIVTDIWIG